MRFEITDITSEDKVRLYCDGACSGNPGPGGWGAVVIFCDNGIEKRISGFENNTTNNRMEMIASIEGVRLIKSLCPGDTEISIYTDSMYLKNGMTIWMPSWKKRGWKNSKGEQVKNMDLWLCFDEEIRGVNVKWHWVKGHSGNKYNDIADKLARYEIVRYKSKMEMGEV